MSKKTYIKFVKEDQGKVMSLEYAKVEKDNRHKKGKGLFCNFLCILKGLGSENYLRLLLMVIDKLPVLLHYLLLFTES